MSERVSPSVAGFEPPNRVPRHADDTWMEGGEWAYRVGGLEGPGSAGEDESEEADLGQRLLPWDQQCPSEGLTARCGKHATGPAGHGRQVVPLLLAEEVLAHRGEGGVRRWSKGEVEGKGGSVGTCERAVLPVIEPALEAPPA